MQSCPDDWAIFSSLHVLRSVGYLPSEWNSVLFYCAYHCPKEIPLLHWGIRQGRCSPMSQPLPLAIFQRSVLIKRVETFLSVLLFSFPPLPSGEAAGWSPPASHILPCLLPLFSHFLKNRVFFQVLYSYSILAIKVPSQPFSFTLWLWPFVRLRIFRVNWSLRSPRMLFSFIHSALWMEQPGVGSSSAALHSGSTQSFFFQGPFKIWPKVCRGVWRSVSHAASYISLPATTENQEQRRDKSKKPTVNENEDPSGLCLPCQCGMLWGHPCLLLLGPHQPGKGPEPQDQGRAWPLCRNSCTMDTPFLQVLSGLREHLQCHLCIHWQSLPLTAGPPFREGKGLFFAFSLHNVWELSPGTDKTETGLWVSQREGGL